MELNVGQKMDGVKMWTGRGGGGDGVKCQRGSRQQLPQELRGR